MVSAIRKGVSILDVYTGKTDGKMIGRIELKRKRKKKKKENCVFSKDNVKYLVSRIMKLILDVSYSLCKKKNLRIGWTQAAINF